MKELVFMIILLNSTFYNGFWTSEEFCVAEKQRIESYSVKNEVRCISEENILIEREEINRRITSGRDY